MNMIQNDMFYSFKGLTFKEFDNQDKMRVYLAGYIGETSLNSKDAHELLQFLFNQLKAIGHPIELK